MIIAAVIGLLLVGLLGPILITVHIPIATTVGEFFVNWGWPIGLLCGLWFFFTNGGWPSAKAP